MTLTSSILRDSPVAYWPLDEYPGPVDVGTVFRDVSGNGFTQTLNEALSNHVHAAALLVGTPDRFPRFIYDIASGRHAEAFSFSIGSSHSGPSGMMTIEGIIFPWSASTTPSTIVSKGFVNVGVQEWRISLADVGRLRATIYTSGGATKVVEITTTASIVGQITHFAVVYDRAPQRMSLYINGVLDGIPVWTPAAVSTASAAYVGLGFGLGPGGLEGDRYDGDLGHVAVFPYALSQRQVLDHYHESLRGGVGY